MARFLCIEILILLSLLAGASGTRAQVPDGWSKMGNKPDSYAVGLDRSTTRSGKQSCYLKSTEEEIEGFGTVMQSIAPGEYLGKRLRLTGYLKAKDVENWAGLWMRVDGEDPRSFLAFDNMQNRPVKGTKDWQQHTIVLDVDKEATRIAFGFLMNGTGTVWADALKLEIVDKSVPTTGFNTERHQAANLDFED